MYPTTKMAAENGQSDELVMVDDSKLVEGSVAAQAKQQKLEHVSNALLAASAPEKPVVCVRVCVDAHVWVALSACVWCVLR